MLRRCFSTLLLLFLLSGGSSSMAQETLDWPYFILPPVFIKGQQDVSGFGPDVIKEICQGIQEENYRLIPATVERMLLNMHEGKNELIFGIFKTPERETFMYFSALPVRLSASAIVAMHNHDAQKFAPDGTVSLASLLENTDLAFGYIPGVSYGPLNDLIKARTTCGDTRCTCTSKGVNNQVQALIRKRVDWIILDPLGIDSLTDQQEFKDEIALIKIKEIPLMFTPGYIAAPKTPWGGKMMERINGTLVQMIRSGSLSKKILPWVPEGLRAEFNKSYNELFVRPASGMAVSIVDD